MQGHSSCYGSMDGHGQGSVIPQPWEQSQNQGAQFCGNLVAGSHQNQPVQVQHCSGQPAVMYSASGHQLQPVQQPQQAQSGQHFSTSMPADPAVQDFAGSRPNAVGLVGGTPQGVVACGTCGTCFAGSASGAMHHLQPGALRMMLEQQNLGLSQQPGQLVVGSAPWQRVASGYSPHGTSVSGYEPYAPHQVRTPPHLTRLQRPPALQQHRDQRCIRPLRSGLISMPQRLRAWVAYRGPCLSRSAQCVLGSTRCPVGKRCRLLLSLPSLQLQLIASLKLRLRCSAFVSTSSRRSSRQGRAEA